MTADDVTTGTSTTLGVGHAAARLSPTRVAIVIVVSAVVVRSGWLASTWYKDDDFVYLLRAAENEMSFAYLFERTDGHFMPGAYALVWVIQSWANAAWWPVVVVSAIFQGAAGWLTWRVLCSLTGERYGAIPLLTIAVWSPLTLGSVMWWASGMQSLPLAVATPAIMLLLQRAVRLRSWTAAMWPAVALLVALLFFEKAVLVAAFVVAVAVAVPVAAGAGSTVVERVRSVWRPALMLLAGIAVFAVAYRLVPDNQHLSTGVVVEDVRAAGTNLVGQAVAPGLLAGPWHWERAGEFQALITPTVLGSVATVIVAGSVVGSIVVLRRTTRLWLILAAYIGSNLAVVSIARSGFLRSLVGLTPRYAADIVQPAVIIAVLVLFGSMHDTLPRWRFTGGPTLGADRSSSGRRIALAATLALLVSGLVSSAALAEVMSPAAGKGYVANARASVATLDVEPDLLLQAAPRTVVNELFAEKDRTTRVVLEPTSIPLHFVEVTSDPHIVLDSGLIAPADVDGLVAEPESGATCVAEVERGRPATIDLPSDLFDWSWFARVDYSVGSADDDAVLVAALDREAQDVRLPAGSGSVVFQLDGAGDVVRVGALGEPICITRIEVGTLQVVSLADNPQRREWWVPEGGQWRSDQDGTTLARVGGGVTSAVADVGEEGSASATIAGEGLCGVTVRHRGDDDFVALYRVQGFAVWHVSEFVDGREDVVAKLPDLPVTGVPVRLVDSDGTVTATVGDEEFRWEPTVDPGGRVGVVAIAGKTDTCRWTDVDVLPQAP